MVTLQMKQTLVMVLAIIAVASHGQHPNQDQAPSVLIALSFVIILYAAIIFFTIWTIFVARNARREIVSDTTAAPTANIPTNDKV